MIANSGIPRFVFCQLPERVFVTMVAIDDDECGDFLSRVEEVNKAIEGLKSGKLDVTELDRKEEQAAKDAAAADARRERAREEKQRKKTEREAAARRQQEAREANRDQIDTLNEQYYLRKARRERWEAFRESRGGNGSGGRAAFGDYYRGWDLFEEDPDEDLFSGDNPASVQDQVCA